ncbi:hypothetical protein [uncultured Microbacterium sp.]|uniref:hypothetical protein n=1 Tax=uncultured Microbacterium sp. TaxID=191216 RepID=UPI0026136F96|nr:hypothetical protein [uncultured Microbacterium sp.]
MSAPDELYPPTQYGWGWLLLALGIIALLILGAFLLILLTRPRTSISVPGQQAPAAPPVHEVLNMLRMEYSAQIDRIEAEYRAGAITARQANIELSRTVRTFVNEYSGLEAPVLSLDDLRRIEVQPALIDALQRHYYPSIFRRGAAVDPLAGAAAARTVVASWH